MRVTSLRATPATSVRTFTILLFTFLAILGPPIALGQRGAITLPRNLADLSLTANQILQGRVVSAAVEPDPRYPNLKILALTLAVDDTLKGAAPTTITLHEFLWDIRDIADNAGYHPGDEVLLFLNRPTTLGFVSPVGLEQGRFRILKGADGQDYAINASQNSGLVAPAIRSGALNPARLSAKSRTAIQSFRGGPIPLSALKESVHLLLQTPSSGAPR